jgi:tripartite-type tricarboxylate transporter receptor subunit TctC
MPRILGLAAVVMASSVYGATAQESVAEFYKGKTVTTLIGFSAGGEYDLHGRIVSRFLGKHLPGNPTVVASQMTGAGTVKLANYLYAVAPKDGTKLGVVSNGLPASQAIGTSGLQFDSRKFYWIGALGPTIETMAMWHTSKIMNVDDAKKREVIVGSTGKGSATFIMPTLMNEMMGTKFKLVTGYRGGANINVAMEREEVQGRNNSWTSWKSTKPQWLAEKKIVIIAYAGPRTDELPGVPNLLDIARNDDDKQVINVVNAGTALGRPLMTTPGVPADRVKALRDAYQAVTKDPEFVAVAKQSRIDLKPIRGEDMQKVVEDVFKTPAPLVARAKAIME